MCNIDVPLRTKYPSCLHLSGFMCPSDIGYLFSLGYINGLLTTFVWVYVSIGHWLSVSELASCLFRECKNDLYFMRKICAEVDMIQQNTVVSVFPRLHGRLLLWLVQLWVSWWRRYQLPLHNCTFLSLISLTNVCVSTSPFTQELCWSCKSAI